MYKNCRILNKITGEIFYGQVDTEFENLQEYEFIEIPDDTKRYKFKNDEFIEDVEQAEQEILIAQNIEERNFLNSTDWKVIRHRDQLALGVETSLTSDEYLALLQERQESRKKVINNGN